MTEPLAMDRTPALAISVALSVSLLSSCTTAKPAAESSAVEPVPVAAASDGGWILVSDNPITFLPKGMPKDAATEFRDGGMGPLKGARREVVCSEGRNALSQEVRIERGSTGDAHRG